MITENTDEIDTKSQRVEVGKSKLLLRWRSFCSSNLWVKECNEPISLEYNTVSIHLDGKVSWDAQLEKFQKIRAKNAVKF